MTTSWSTMLGMAILNDRFNVGIGCLLIALRTAMSIGSPRLPSPMSSAPCLPGTCSTLAKLEAGMSNEERDHWLKSTAEKRSRTVLSSGGLEPVLDSGGGNHSVFAKAFLDVLAGNTEILDGQRLGLEVAARVSYAASSAQ